jgi:hypothetical protein
VERVFRKPTFSLIYASELGKLSWRLSQLGITHLPHSERYHTPYRPPILNAITPPISPIDRCSFRLPNRCPFRLPIPAFTTGPIAMTPRVLALTTSSLSQRYHTPHPHSTALANLRKSAGYTKLCILSLVSRTDFANVTVDFLLPL